MMDALKTLQGMNSEGLMWQSRVPDVAEMETRRQQP